MQVVGILDMYAGEPNQGMRCIQEIIGRYPEELAFQVYDVRGNATLPQQIDQHRIYIATGGPGNPEEGDGVWDKAFGDFIQAIYEANKQREEKIFVLFICHSFQMAVKHFGLAQITKRKATSFGVMTVHKTAEGMEDPLFHALENPFWAVDSRDYQVVKPKKKRFTEMGAAIIALEKIRTHVEYERAIMGVRFSPELVGTQFHPEADPESFLHHLKKPEVREKIIALKAKPNTVACSSIS
ncbi:GMP synthase [Nitritalea halalkaliphila LW7]|uniref:GMP synthase n=1 Tax=Nitritalea halalkaliphila LW7 TaxID=1189621 RepID=I5C4N4_9BACT|nr:GMP synthase [Nitritalea halalkaliphila]EIM76786.1 GMP synthase [Nitritalea halalkaliphila LW7]